MITLEASWALHQPSGNEHDVLAYGEDAGLAVYSSQLFESGEGNEYRIVQNPRAPAIAYPHCSRAEHFINVLLGDEAPIINIEQSLAVQRVLDGIYESAATGKEIRL